MWCNRDDEAEATNSEKNLILIKRCTKLKVRKAAPPAITAIQQSDATPPNMNKKNCRQLQQQKV